MLAAAARGSLADMRSPRRHVADWVRSSGFPAMLRPMRIDTRHVAATFDYDAFCVDGLLHARRICIYTVTTVPFLQKTSKDAASFYSQIATPGLP